MRQQVLADVFLDVWESIFSKVISTCSAELPSRRSSCVSVLTLVGIKFRIASFSGRMSWCCAASRPSQRYSRFPGSACRQRLGYIYGHINLFLYVSLKLGYACATHTHIPISGFFPSPQRGGKRCSAFFARLHRRGG